MLGLGWRRQKGGARALYGVSALGMAAAFLIGTRVTNFFDVLPAAHGDATGFLLARLIVDCGCVELCMAGNGANVGFARVSYFGRTAMAKPGERHVLR